jgi:transposase
MAMGTRKMRERQEDLWYGGELPTAPGHPFYQRLNEVLDGAKFDAFCETHCTPFYHDRLGRPSLPPGQYFRIMMIGFFEGLDSERGIAWRLADSLTLRQFLSLGLDEKTPDHVTISRTRRLIDAETHQCIFSWVLEQLAQAGLIKGKTIGVDSTTLEANAAMKSIVRRDTGEDWNEYLRRLLKQEQGIENPTDEELRRFDRQRKNKRVSNEEWVSATDPESRIAKMKDGRTHLAYKAEHVVDLETEVVLAASIRKADEADTDTMMDSIVEAQANLSEAGIEVEIKEVVADKGYHATDTLELADSLSIRPYIPERKHKGNGKRNWKDVPQEKRRAVLNNRRRTRGARSKRLQRWRSERVERSFAHICETGGARRSWLCGIQKVQKRYLIAAVARNLGLVMRKLFNMGTARGLQAEGGLVCVASFAWFHMHRFLRRVYGFRSRVPLARASLASAA